MRTRHTLIFSILILFCISYTDLIGQRINSISPESSKNTYTYSESESILYVPIRLSLDTLTSLIKDHLPKNIQGKFEYTGVEDGKYRVKIQGIQYKVINNQYQVEGLFVKGSASALLGWKFGSEKLGVTPKINHLSGNVFVQPRIGLNNYQIYANPTLATHVNKVDLKGCLDLPIFGEVCSPSVNVSGAVKKALDYEIKQKQDQIKSSVNLELKKLNLPQKIQSLWDTLHQPITLDNSVDPIFLSLKPTAVLLNPLHFDHKFLHMGLGIKTQTAITDSPVKTSTNSIPNPLIEPDTMDGLFNVNLPIDIKYTTIESLLEDSLKNKVINYKNKPTIKIKNVKFYGKDGDHFVLGLDIKGLRKSIKKVKGWVYITGTLKFDPETYSLEVDQYDLETETNKNLLNKGLNFIANKLLYKSVIKKMNFSYKDELGKAVTTLDNKLKSGIETPLGNITGSFESLKLNQLIFADSRLHIDVTFSGKLDEFTLNLHEIAK